MFNRLTTTVKNTSQTGDIDVEANAHAAGGAKRYVSQGADTSKSHASHREDKKSSLNSSLPNLSKHSSTNQKLRKEGLNTSPLKMILERTMTLKAEFK